MERRLQNSLSKKSNSTFFQKLRPPNHAEPLRVQVLLPGLAPRGVAAPAPRRARAVSWNDKRGAQQRRAGGRKREGRVIEEKSKRKKQQGGKRKGEAAKRGSKERHSTSLSPTLSPPPPRTRRALSASLSRGPLSALLVASAQLGQLSRREETRERANERRMFFFSFFQLVVVGPHPLSLASVLLDLFFSLSPSSSSFFCNLFLKTLFPRPVPAPPSRSRPSTATSRATSTST